jgi:hypothetical protein
MDAFPGATLLAVVVGLAACGSHAASPAVEPTAPESAAPEAAGAAVSTRPSAAPPTSPALQVSAAPAAAPSADADDGPDDPMTALSETSPPVRTPGVKQGLTTVSGRLHPSRITATMRSQYPAVRSCYEKAPEGKATDGAPVEVRLRFVIGRDGSVTQVTDSGDREKTPLSDCVLDIIKKTRFQSPQAGIVTVTYPITLTKD